MATHVQTVCIALIVFIVGCDGSCPDGSIFHDGSCYNIYHLQVSWSEANFYCKLFGSELVTIETPEEQNYLSNYLQREHAGAFTPGKFWTGVTTILSSSWHWISGQPMTYNNWTPNDPDDVQEKKCAGMGFESKFLWYSAACENKYNFICETPFGVNTVSIIG